MLFSIEISLLKAVLTIFRNSYLLRCGMLRRYPYCHPQRDIIVREITYLFRKINPFPSFSCKYLKIFVILRKNSLFDRLIINLILLKSLNLNSYFIGLSGKCFVIFYNRSFKLLFFH